MGKQSHTTRPLLGAILEQKFGLSEAKLLEALNLQQTKGGRLGEALLKIRAIEDDLLVTDTGVTWMTGKLPRSIADIEAFMVKAPKEVPYTARRAPTGGVLVAAMY